MATYADRIKVFLPTHHVAEALAHAQKRNGKEEKYGAMTYGGCKTKHGGQAAHEIGILAELGMSLYWGADYDKRVFDDHGDDGRDMYLPPPLGVTQIKANGTYYTDTDMRCEVEHDHEYIDSYVLVVVRKIPEARHIVELSGWLPRIDVIRRPASSYHGSGMPDNYIWKETELTAHPLIGANLKRSIKVYYDNTPNPEQEFWEYVRDLQRRAVI